MKRRLSSIPVVGFEYLPCGQLLTQFVDFRHPMGAAYERCVHYEKDYHTHDRINLTFPRNSSVIQFTTKNPSATFVVDETKFLWMPENVTHHQGTVSSLYDNLAIFPSAEIAETAFQQFQKKYSVTALKPAETLLKKRTPFLDALLDEYFSERVLERRKASQVEGLTFQIFEELLRILFRPRRGKPEVREKEAAGELATTRAVRFIEGNLFGQLDSAAIASTARVSVPTLFRKFKSDMKMTPREYISRRRMDEASTLLRRGEYTVGDIALLIGYEDIAAFSKAFKSHFGKSPSVYRSRVTIS